MWKYSKYDKGDIVGHIKALKVIFEIIDVFPAVNEEIGKYLYLCKILVKRGKQHAPQGWATADDILEDQNNPQKRESEKVFKYAEEDLYPLRLPALQLNELDVCLQKAANKEEYEKAAIIQNEINSRKINQ